VFDGFKVLNENYNVPKNWELIFTGFTIYKVHLQNIFGLEAHREIKEYIV
jgi:hypothetical protein